MRRTDEKSDVRFRWEAKMVDGFDTTILFILQLIVGVLCIPVIGVATGVRCTAHLGGPRLWVWNVLSGLVRQAARWQPENRLLETFCLVPVRARPLLAVSQCCCGCCQRGGSDAPVVLPTS